MLFKIAFFVLMFAIVYVLWELIKFVRAILFNPEGYKMTTLRLVGLGLSLSYILTIIFTGFGV